MAINWRLQLTATKTVESLGGLCDTESSSIGDFLEKCGIRYGFPLKTVYFHEPHWGPHIDPSMAMPDYDYLICSDINDSQLELLVKTLEPFPVPPRLMFIGTSITDQGLQSISRLSNLRELDLTGTHITDAGLRYLTSLRNLESLGLSETAMSDKGVKDLAQLTNLRCLRLDHTSISERAISELKAALPQLEVYRLEYYHADDPFEDLP